MWDGHTQFEAFRFPPACVSLESEGDAERELTRLERRVPRVCALSFSPAVRRTDAPCHVSRHACEAC